MTQQVNSQEWLCHRVNDGHIVDRCDDLETAYEQIIARCYNRKKDGSLGHWKHSSFTHHDFEVMRRLIFDGGYLQNLFREAVGLTEYVDPPEKPAGVDDALHQKALREARMSMWEALTSGDYIYFTLRDFIEEAFAGHYEGALADLAAERSRSRNNSGVLYNVPGTPALGLSLSAPPTSVRRSVSVGAHCRPEK